ncbi:hypothetical protein GCK72_024701 [Caenorhabditis remanei]|uniref:Uncharacterized protein n=2 Tax=Caenorhabditis remanei TaxID=31234 RepID=E3LD60_CAERE|nr:hypothetical protein GCK72_024701 [Caenorhabditis remanei]EFO82462.1 hypothetical protein CRE_00102 [Caenorhabditis remanei]KAF1748234.1 hypothetical protein GCK72_024701 [Caenorhabditis remanei]
MLFLEIAINRIDYVFANYEERRKVALVVIHYLLFFIPLIQHNSDPFAPSLLFFLCCYIAVVSLFLRQHD